MKKVFYILIIFLLPICFLVNNNTYNFYSLFSFNDANFCYIYNEKDFDLQINNEVTSFKKVKNGNKLFIFFKEISPFKNYTPQYMQVTYNVQPQNLQEILNKIKAKIVEIQNFENSKIYFYYTPVFKNFVTLNNKKVNLQIVKNNISTTIGHPMIYGSF